MNIILNKKFILTPEKLVVGYCEENKAETFYIDIQPEQMFDKEVRLEFQVNDGDKYTTEELDVLEGMVTYPIPNGLLSEKGTLKVQLVFSDDLGVIKKSNVIKLFILQSICAGDELAKEYPDFISEAQKAVEACKNVKPAVIDVEELTDLNESSLYRTKKVSGGKIQGTAIPDSGTTTLDNFIYPNFDLSISEVVAYLEKLNANTYNVLVLGSQVVLYVKNDNGTWKIVLGIREIFNSKTGWNKELFNSGINEQKQFLKLMLETDVFSIDKLSNNKNELIKNVLSSKEYELVGADVSYPLYHVKDGQVMEVMVKDDSVTVIDLADLEEEFYGMRELTLPNGTYVVYNTLWETSGVSALIQFGRCKGLDCSKFITFANGRGDYIGNFSSGIDEQDGYVSLNKEAFEYNKNVYIVVKDNEVIINVSYEV